MKIEKQNNSINNGAFEGWSVNSRQFSITFGLYSFTFSTIVYIK